MSLIEKDREQVIPKGAAAVAPKGTAIDKLREDDAELADMVEDLIGAMHQDMIPGELQEKIFSAFNPAVRRGLIAKEAGLEATILVTLKDQMRLVEAVLSRTFNKDGSLKASEKDDIAMNPKDVLNLSVRVSQMMIKELPKIYNVDRYQKLEQAILNTVEKHLSKEAQQTFITEIEAQTNHL